MELQDFRIIPVVVVNDARRSTGLGEALVAGGLPVAEITLRTPAALDAIRELAADSRVVVGAGTVLNATQATAALDAGARFLVSPGLSLGVVAAAAERGVPVVPGAVTPTEIIAALDAGVTTCKFFPADVFGGAPTLRALGAVFGQVRFVPTGGVNPGNLAEYLGLPNVSAVGGSWMVPAAAIDAGDFRTVRRLCAEAVAVVAGPEAVSA